VPARSVLIVDDSAAIRKALCEFFTLQGGFEICGEAENGSEAIEKALLLQPALIVTDLSMPLMNGLEETRILKKLMPAVPIIIYTAHSGPIAEKDGLAAGASAVISKSDDLAVLIGKARELLDRIAA
jgi:DNA-binding NarL/FixJ family response regulator